MTNVVTTIKTYLQCLIMLRDYDKINKSYILSTLNTFFGLILTKNKIEYELPIVYFYYEQPINKSYVQ